MKRYATRRRVIAAAVLIAILMWWLWPNRHMARVQALQRELADSGQTLSPEQRQEKFRQLRTEMQKLSPQQREQLAADGRRRGQEEVARYFTLSPAEKQKHLDRQMDREEEMRRRGQNRSGPQAGGPPQGGSGGPGGSNPQTPEDRERRRQQRLDSSTPEFRAQMDQFRRDMELRRKQRGLPPSPGPGRGR